MQAMYVSESVAGDYFQVSFDANEDSDKFDPDEPYLLIQRQFEFPDGGRVRIETHDINYVGEFRIRRVEFTREKFAIELNRSRDNTIEVTYPTLGDREYRRILRVLNIMTGRKVNRQP